MLKSLIFSSMLLAASLCAQTPEWRFDFPGELKQSTSRNADCAIDESQKTPDYYTSVRIKTGTDAEFSCLPGKQTFERADSYLLSFFIKADRRGKGTVRCDGEKERAFPLSTEWEKVEFQVAITEFKVTFDLPDHTTVHLGPVTLRPVQTEIPYSLNREYFYLRGKGPVDRIPENAKRGKGESLVFGRAKFEKEPAMLWMKLPSDRDGRMEVAMRADWYFECWLNGKNIYNTMKTGNLEPARFFRFFLPLKKGENLLAVKLFSGSGGFGLVWRKGCHYRPVRFIPSTKFKPMNMANFEYKKGTVLDFSSLLDHAPAGKFGRVIAGKDGHLALEKRSRPIRFKAFNFLITDWRGRYELLSHQELEDLADRIAIAGYNMVRFHFLDRFLLGHEAKLAFGHGFNWKKMAQTEAELRINEKCYDAFAYLFHALKKRGIYAHMDLMSSADGYEFGRDGLTPGENSGFKWNLFFNKHYRANYRMAVTWLMNRINPYTGLALKEDPAVAVVTLLNEQDLRLENINFRLLFTQPFRIYLKRKYPDESAFRAVWGEKASIDTLSISAAVFKEGSRRSRDIGDFIRETMMEMTDYYRNILQDIGYKGLYSQWDMVTRNFSMPVQNTLPVIMSHTYFNHPLPISLIPEIRPNSKYRWAQNQRNRFVGQGSSLDSPYLRAIASTRFADRPFLVTEFSHSAPNRFRHERGLYFSSYAALQDWDCLTVHSDLVLKRNPDPIYFHFDSALDPMSRVNEILETLIWLRGDVKPARHRVELRLRPEIMYPKYCIAKVSDDYDRLAMLTRIGISCGPKRNPDAPAADLVLTPSKFGNLSIQGFFAQIDPSGNGEIAKFAELLRGKGILPPGNRTNPREGIYESETGELLLNTRKKTMKVVTPRLEGCIIKENVIVSLDCLTVKKSTVPACIAAASLNPKETLKDASRVLLIIATDSHPSGQTFTEPTLSVMTDPGESPALIQSGKFHLKFRSGRKTKPKFYALNMDGTRSEELPCALHDGVLTLRLDTSRLKYGTPCFEISYEGGFTDRTNS